MHSAHTMALPPAGGTAPASQSLIFRASGSEYFRLWIVNLLLTIVTLGVYSAWAKVRRNRYFYACTELDGNSFDYHGNPVAILKGRGVVGMLAGAYHQAFSVSPRAGLVMFAVMAAVMPWLYWRSLQFKLHNTSYRGIRFSFGGSVGQAYIHYLLLPIVGVLSLGLALPLAQQRVARFQYGASRYGSARFAFDATAGGFYWQYAGIALLSLGVLGAAGGLLFAGKIMLDLLGIKVAGAAAVPLLLVALYMAGFVIYACALCRLYNFSWNHASLEGQRFHSALKPGRLLMLWLTNALGVVCTLGLFMPFAQVRWLKYRLGAMSLQVDTRIGQVEAGSARPVGGAGEALADWLNFDLAL